MDKWKATVVGQSMRGSRLFLSWEALDQHNPENEDATERGHVEVTDADEPLSSFAHAQSSLVSPVQIALNAYIKQNRGALHRLLKGG